MILLKPGFSSQMNQVDEYSTSERSKGRNLDVLKKQIRFRWEVLGQFMDGDKGFTFTGVDPNSKSRSNKSVEELKVHFLKLINAAKKWHTITISAENS